MRLWSIKILLFFSILFLIINYPIYTLAQEQPNVQILLDGYPVTFDVAPIIKDGRTLVPFRAIAEALGVLIEWDDKTRTITATDGKNNIKLQIGNKVAYLNNDEIFLDVPPQIVNDRTLIPIRFFSEAFNCKVDWDPSTYSVKITSPVKEMSILGFYALGDSKTSSWTNLFGKSYPEYAPGNTDVISWVELGWYSADSDGNLLTKSRTGWQRPDGWEKVLEAAGQYKIKTEMVVHVADADLTITNLLSSRDAMEKLSKAISEEAKFYDGVNLDFEGLGLNETGDALSITKQRFTEFVKLLRNDLDKSKTLTLSLHAPNSAYKGYDYRSLGEVADKIIVMAYDYGTKPEPEKLVVQAIEQALKDVPKKKLILGISVPSETPESVAVKIGLAKRYGLNGIALWRLGLITDEMWNVLRNTVSAQR